MHVTATVVAMRAALEEAGFEISAWDASQVAARHPRHLSVHFHASLMPDGWHLCSVHGARAIPITPRTLPELIYLLTQSYGADARARRGQR